MTELLTLLHGDAIEKMRSLADESVHFIITSPPYWGLRLRDYKIPPSIWGGDPQCRHKWGDVVKRTAIFATLRRRGSERAGRRILAAMESIRRPSRAGAIRG